MKLEMKVENVFAINGKTIFTGDLQTSYTYISSVDCCLIIDGIEVRHVVIEGEVFSAGGHRDLWSHETVEIDPNTLKTHDIKLVSA